MRIIKQEEGDGVTRASLKFFKAHFKELGKVKYVILYYAEDEWVLNPDLMHQYVIIIGENCQLWMSGLAWGYYGEGPYGLFEVMQMIDLKISYEEIVSLGWETDDVYMFENVNGRLLLKSFNESARSFLCGVDNRLPWENRFISS